MALEEIVWMKNKFVTSGGDLLESVSPIGTPVVFSTQKGDEQRARGQVTFNSRDVTTKEISDKLKELRLSKKANAYSVSKDVAIYTSLSPTRYEIPVAIVQFYHIERKSDYHGPYS